MKFYVIRIKYLLDGTEKKSEVMAYDNLTKAVAKFHTNIGTDMEDSTLVGSLCMVINSEGGIHKNEKWVREGVEPIEEEVTE